MHPTREAHRWQWYLGAGILFGLLTLVGCTESTDSSCGSDSDCASGEECLEGVCQLAESDRCTHNSHCPLDFVCRNFQCEPEPDTGGPTDTGEDESDTGPEVVGFNPARGANEVDPSSAITITFSEPIRNGSIHGDSLSLIDADGRPLGLFGQNAGASVSHPAPDTLVIEADNEFHPASPYRLVLARHIQDENRNQLVDAPVEITFSTSWPQPREHVMAARKWAPWIYQGIANTRGTGPHNDLPTTIDFDDDYDASNNHVNAVSSEGTAPKAHLYYHVAETKTHLLLTYLAYYPSFRDVGGDHYEHHFAGLRLIVDKATDSLVVADGLALRKSDAEWVAFTEEGSEVSQIGQVTDLIQVKSSNWKLENDTHYPAYVMAGNHGTCHWYSEGGSSGLTNVCQHESGEFIAGGGALLKPGADAQGWEDRNTEGAHPTLTYKLVPLVEDFWTMRNHTGSSRLFGERFAYEPNSADSGRMAGFPGSQTSHRLPKTLNSDDPESVGSTPFRWRSFSNEEGDGQWTLDPAYVSADRFAMGENQTDISLDYCFNLFFGIDKRGNQDCPSSTGGDAGIGADGGTTSPDAATDTDY